MLYLFSGIFIDNYVFVFVVCILLLAFDFWTVKVHTLLGLFSVVSSNNTYS